MLGVYDDDLDSMKQGLPNLPWPKTFTQNAIEILIIHM